MIKIFSLFLLHPRYYLRGLLELSASTCEFIENHTSSSCNKLVTFLAPFELHRLIYRDGQEEQDRDDVDPHGGRRVVVGVSC